MTTTISEAPSGREAAASAPGATRVLLVAGLSVGALLAVAGALWAHYGTTVFFEMIRTGWIACF